MQLHTKRALWLCLAIICTTSLFSSRAFGQLSGNYTIDASSAASSTNYKSFASAISDLTSGTRSDGGTANGSGVSGAVTFKIADGMYKEQISIGAITGVSASKTITFQSSSGDSSKVILYDSTSSSSTKNYTLELSGANYITFKQITIMRPGTDNYAIVMSMNGGASNNKFIGNRFIGKLYPSTTTIGIVAGNAVIYSSGTDTSNLFQGNRIKYGYNGIYINGSDKNNKIIDNIMDTCGMSAIFAYYQTGLVVSGNITNLGTIKVSGVSHYLTYGIRLESSINFQIVKNKFYATSEASVCRCIVVFNGSSSGGKRNLIANNFAWVSAGSSSSTGITLGGNSDLDVVYNSVLITSTPSASAALYYYSGYSRSSNVIKNNNLINMGTGMAIDNSPTTYTTAVTSDYNNLYTKGSYIGNNQGTKYTTLSAWLATGFDSNSLSADPGYVSNKDLHASSSAINNHGTPILGVTDDIDGVTRSTTKPDIGANEFTPDSLDVGITVLDSPTTYCASTKNIIVQYTNFGSDTIKKLNIKWSVNGTSQTTYSWTGSLPPAAVSSAITLGSLSLSSNTAYTLKIWPDAPNGGADMKGTNDTLLKTINSGLTGSYTIGGSSPDFAKFNDALDAITLRGLCGPVVFKVRDGKYNEQLSIPAYTASSSTNTITFQGENGDSSKVILTYGASNANGTNNVTLQLNGASYITFKNMTIQRDGSGIYQAVIELKGKANHNSFMNNQLFGIKLSTSSTESNIVTSTAGQDNSNTFSHNYFKYGNSAFSITSDAAAHESNNVIEGNIIDSTYNTAIIATYNDGIAISGNQFAHTAYGSSSYYAVNVISSANAININANRIEMPYGGAAGIFLLRDSAGSSTPGLITNNLVSIGSSSSSARPYGILDSSSDYQHVYYNSVQIYNANNGAAFYANAGNTELKNNILYNADGGYAIVTSGSALSASDYNNFYTKGTSLGLYGGSAESNLSAWQSAVSMDANSFSINPKFVGTADYHTYNLFMYGKATPLASVTTDIEGTTRSSSNPSPGAWEIRPPANEAGIKNILSPDTAICACKQDVIVDVKNTKTGPLTSVNIYWQVNNDTPVNKYSWSGTIAADSMKSINIGSYTFTTASNTIKVYTADPNGKVDSFPDNDTMTMSFKVNAVPVVKAGSGKNICIGDSTMIGDTAVSGLTYSWTSNPSGFTSSSAMLKVAPTATTTYYLEATNGNGCSAVDSVTVKVYTTPVAKVGSPKTVCSGYNTTIGDTAVSGLTYSWTSNPSGFTSNSANPVITPTAKTTYILTVTNPGGCTATDSVTISVNSSPFAYAGKDADVCTGDSAQIGDSATSGMTYSWTSSPSGFTSSSSMLKVAPTATTTYYLEVSNGSCSAFDTVKVNVHAYPKAAVGSSKAICNGDKLTLGDTAVSGITYSWTSYPSGFTSSSAMPVVKPSTTTTYYLTATNATGCSSSDSVTITVNALPTASVGSAKTICDGASVQIGDASVSGLTYSWTSNPSGFTSSSANPTVTPGATTRYILKVTNGNGCSATDSVLVTVNPLPVVKVGTSISICDGESTQIGSSSVSGMKYSWTSNPSGFTSSSANPTVTPTATTTYILEVTNSNGCSAKDSVTVTVNPLPTASVAKAQTICAGDNVNIGSAAVSGLSYSWTSNPSGFKSTSANPSVNPTTTTTYILEVMNGNGCKAQDSVTITVNPLPVANVGKSQSICKGESAQIGDVAVSGLTYSWFSYPLGYTSSSANPTVSPTATTTYILQVVNGNGCKAYDSVTITVHDLPKAVTGPDQTICANSSATIGSTAVSGNSYTWTSVPAGFTSTSANPTVTPAATTTYILTESVDATGCKMTDSVTITVNPLPTPNAGADQDICYGSSATLGSSSTSGHSYSWTSIPSGFTSTTVNPVVNPLTTTTYVLTESNDATGCSATDTVVVNVLALPVPGNISGKNSVCAGSASVYRPASSTSGLTYTFSLTGNGILSQAADSAVVTWENTSGTADLWMVAENASGCKDSVKLGIIINDNPKASFSATEVCEGNATQFTDNSTGGVKTYWSFGDGDTTSAVNPAHTYAAAGSYQATILVLNASGCYDTTSVMVKVNALPKPAFSMPSSVCQGATVNFTNGSTGSVSSYAWKFGDGATSSDNAPSHIYNAPGTYTIVLVASTASGCTDSVSHTITVNPLPNAGFRVKQGMSRDFSFDATDKTQSGYSWDFGDGNSGTGASATHSYAAEGTYTVRLTVTSSAGCTDTKDTSMLVKTNGISDPGAPGFSVDIYPNPFNEGTTISYSVAQSANVNIVLMDITGKQVAQLVNDLQASGKHTFNLKARNYDLKSGVYFVNILVDGVQTTRKLIKVE